MLSRTHCVLCVISRRAKDQMVWVYAALRAACMPDYTLIRYFAFMYKIGKSVRLTYLALIAEHRIRFEIQRSPKPAPCRAIWDDFVTKSGKCFFINYHHFLAAYPLQFS
jgi:hypothetical protein